MGVLRCVCVLYSGEKRRRKNGGEKEKVPSINTYSLGARTKEPIASCTPWGASSPYNKPGILRLPHGSQAHTICIRNQKIHPLKVPSSRSMEKGGHDKETTEPVRAPHKAQLNHGIRLGGRLARGQTHHAPRMSHGEDGQVKHASWRHHPAGCPARSLVF